MKKFFEELPRFLLVVAAGLALFGGWIGLFNFSPTEERLKHLEEEVSALRVRQSMLPGCVPTSLPRCTPEVAGTICITPSNTHTEFTGNRFENNPSAGRPIGSVTLTGEPIENPRDGRIGKVGKK